MTAPRAARVVPALAAILAVAAGCTALQTERGGRGGTVADAPAVDRFVDGQAIDRLFSEYAAPGAPGAAVAVLHQGRVVHARGYGLAELETGNRVTERTNFRLASLTKPFTAMATLLLVRDGRLDLDDPVHAVLPDFPAYARAVRIRHLLTHTSGLRPYQDLAPPSSVRHVKDRDVLALLKRADTLLFRPGSEFRYGDSGYAVLALVVETVSGEPFARFLHDRIFEPSGMTETLAWEPGGPAVPHRAYGYRASRRGGFRLADHSNTSTVLGDGGIYASVRDLIAWDRALDEHRVLDARWLARAWTPTTLTDGTRAPYGLGWFLEHDARGRSAFHHGITSGFSNVYVKYPDERLTIVVLTNRRGGRPREIAAAIAALPSFRRAAAR